MSALFSKPKMPKMPEAPEAPEPVPTVAHEQVQGKVDKTRKRERSARGRASTMLTGGAGVTQSAQIGTKKLLGQ